MNKKNIKSNICPECKEPKLFFVKKVLEYHGISKNGKINPCHENETLEEIVLCENLCEVKIQ